MTSVAVVGGGYAGMAAAVTLAARGAKVVVHEAGPVLGGRARRVQTRGESFDNGQHILVGAYGALLGMMRSCGVPSDALLRLPLELRYVDGFVLRPMWLPEPLGLLGGLLAARLPWRERLGAIRFMLAMRRARYRVEPDRAVSELLANHAQDGRIGHYLWRPLCVSALNTPPEQSSANAFLAVIRDSLAGGDGASDLLLPKSDLSTLFPEPAADCVRARGGEVRVSSPVRDLDALRKDHSHVVVAVGPHHLDALIPGVLPPYTYQPIVTCYLQYAPEAKLPFPMLGLADGLVQWTFDRGHLLGERGRIACVVSAQGEHQQMTHDEIAATCARELSAAFPGLGTPASSQVIFEKRATIACTPGLTRVGPETPLRNVWLAGDYTDPVYPPTLEAAVRSGIRAAGCILRGS